MRQARRRGRWSLRLFALIAAVSLAAELLAAGAPLLVIRHGAIFAPAFAPVAESRLGGSLPGPADWRDPALTARIAAEADFILWPLLRLDPAAPAADAAALDAPSRAHLLGTDDQARDVLARLLYGLRTSLLFAFALTLLSAALGLMLGALMGFAGGVTDLALQRLVEIWAGLPVLYVLIILSSLIVPGFVSLLAILLLFGWTGYVGAVRAEVLRTRRLAYVQAAEALGARPGRVLLRHVLPNALTATLAVLPFHFAAALATLTSLDFLGLGLPAGTPSLGELVRQGKAHLEAPWLGLTAAGALTLVLTLAAFIGESLRDAFDPRRRLRPA